MKEKKIIELLRLFSRKEMKEFMLFVSSPFHNTNVRIVKLLEFMIKHHPKFDGNGFTLELAGYAAFGDEMPKGGFAKLLSHLLTLAESFIHISKVKDDKSTTKFETASFCFKRRAFSLSERENADAEKLLNKNSERGRDYFYKYFNFEELASGLYMYGKKSSYESTVLEAMKMLDYYFLAAKLRLAAAMKAIGQIKGEKHEVFMFKAAMENVRLNYEYMPQLVKVWYLALSLLEEDDLALYDKLKKEWLDSLEVLPVEDLTGIWTILLNRFARLVSSKSLDFYQEVFHLHEIGIRHKCVYKEGNILPSLFNNIITVALIVNELDWAQDFLNTNSSALPNGQKENVTAYNQARIDFERGEFENCIHVLSQLNYKSAFEAVGIKRVQLKSYYELGEEELLESGINSFRTYVYRLDELADYHKKAYLNFATALSKLERARSELKEKLVVENLKKDILGEGGLPERLWFEKKLDELE